MRNILISFFVVITIAACAHDPHDHGHETPGKTAGFKVALDTSPNNPGAGQPVAMTFRVSTMDGTSVRDFEVVHEKPMHLLIVSEDLEEFYHLHPEPGADGSLGLNFTFPNAGKFRMFVDFKPKGGPQSTESIPISVAGNERKPADPVVTEDLKVRAGDVFVEMKADSPVAAGKDVTLNFVLTGGDGAPLTDLENYLGEKAHFVIISKDLKEFVHAHPIKSGQSGTVASHVNFPTAGIYKLWAQFKRSGKVFTVPYVIDVPAH